MGRRKFQDGDLIRITPYYDRFYRLNKYIGRVKYFADGFYHVEVEFSREGNGIALLKANQGYLATNNKEVYEYEQWEQEQARNAEPLVGATNI